MTFEKPLSEGYGDEGKVQCETCGKWFDDSELDAHLNEHLNEPAGENAEPEPGVLSESQEARIRAIIREEVGFWKLVLAVIVVLFFLWFLFGVFVAFVPRL